jgi:hypothetical protein
MSQLPRPLHVQGCLDRQTQTVCETPPRKWAILQHPSSRSRSRPIIHPLHRPRRFIVAVVKSQINHLGRGALVARSGRGGGVTRGNAGRGSEMRGGRRGASCCRSHQARARRAGDFDDIIVKEAGFLASSALPLVAGDRPFAVGLDGDLLDRLGSRAQDFSSISGHLC